MFSSSPGLRRLRCESLEHRLLLSVTMTEYEQLMLYFVNRARVDPLAEASRYDIGLNDGLPGGTISSDAKQPLIPNQALADASVSHSLDMLERNFFAHKNPDGEEAVDRALAEGYPSTYVGENISWEGSTGTLDAASQPARRHESLFRSPTHRRNILYDSYQDIGVGLRLGEFTDSGTTYNAAMVTEDFGRRNDDTYLVGVVFDDANGNGVYDLNEGIADASVQVGDQKVTTGGSGGWFLQVVPGVHDVVVSGSSFGETATSTVQVDDQNMEVDFISGQSWGVVNFDNTAPVQGVDDQYFVEVSQPLSVPVDSGLLTNDVDPSQSGLTAQLVDPPEHGTLKLDYAGSFSYEPTSGYRGLDTFTYRAEAGQEISGLTTVTLVVGESLGTVDYRELTELDVSGGAIWYRLESSQSGIFSVIADSSQSFTLTLYDSVVEPLASSSSEVPRIDQTVAEDESLYLAISGTGVLPGVTILNLVATVDGEIQVSGTDGADHFGFAPTGSYVVTINGIDYDFDETEYEAIEFNGGAGDDTATLTGGSGAEIARFFPDKGTFDGDGFQVTVNNVVEITAHGGGGADEAYLYDSAGDDEFVVRKGYGKLSGEGFVLETFDFMYNYGYATTREGGNDVARMGDAPENDKFKFDWPKEGQFFGKMYGGGVYYNRAKNFEQIEAVMTEGKNTVRLFDSEGDDTFDGQKDESRFTGTGFDVTVSGYDSMAVYASEGFDVANLVDSEDDDTTRARSHKITLWGGDDADPTYEIMARRFDEYHFEGKYGGEDRAKLHDTVLNDHAAASGDTASLSTNDGELDLLYEVVGFEWVRLYAADGKDTLVKEEPLEFEFVYTPGEWNEL